jgi:gamma-glutamyltranspeptidase/glutathione hydrolase/leukotriene-C4 hydrolase
MITITNRSTIKIIILLLAALTLIGIITGCILYANFTFTYSTGAIASNGLECAAMGRQIFKDGGTVADVAVTTILCEGIASPHSCGIGGGFILTMYLKKEQVVKVLNARERAPRNATADMFVAEPGLSTSGGKAVAVPGDVKGLWELHQRHGKLKWKKLLQPVIDLCRNGIEVGDHLARMITSYENGLRAEPSLREIFINQVTNETLKLGEKYKRLKLAETLEVIAEQGADAIYGGGEIGRKMVEDVQKRGGVMIEKDLRDYR